MFLNYVKKELRFNNKGFTLISVIVASVIGLIVVMATTKMFVNMHTQLNQSGQQSSLREFSKEVFNLISGDCKTILYNSLSDDNLPDGTPAGTRDKLWEGKTTPAFYKIDPNFDLKAEKIKSRLERQYGIYEDGNNFFEIECARGDPSPCDCSKPSVQDPCLKTYTFSFNSQSLVKDLPKYNQPLNFHLEIEWEIDGVQKKIKECRLAGGGGLSFKTAQWEHFNLQNTGNKNIMVGGGTTAKNTEAKHTTAFGYNAGPASGKHENNTFIGYEAGFKTKSGNNNTFIGHQSGQENTTKSNNIFLGYQAGLKNTSGENNVFIGYQAGLKNTEGSNNVFIGYQAGNTDDYKTANNKFIVGNDGHPEWLKGTIGEDDLQVKVGNVYRQFCFRGERDCLRSSRTLKKNIKSFTNYKQALKDILKTPLFIYEYKAYNPEKSRMGIISEDLPKTLQIKEKGKVSRPDWPSIYGSFWASIKALHKLFEDLQTKLFKEIETLNKAYSLKLEKNKKSIIKKLETLKADIYPKLKTIDSQIEDIKNNKKKWINDRDKLQTEILNRQKIYKAEQSQWIQTQKEIDIVTKELKEIKKESQSLKELCFNNSSHL